jgi:tetratricopeptide (TPR) repeat protein
MDNQGNKDVNKGIPTSAEFQKGQALFNSNSSTDSAFYYFSNVTQVSKDSLLVAMSYTYMAMIQEAADDHFGSQESALEGLRHVNKKNSQHHYCLASIYNELGLSSVGLKNYDAAIKYYGLSIKFNQDESYKAVVQNNIAVAYREKGDYQNAIRILESVMQKQSDNKLGYARSLTNLASLRWAADSSFYPVPQLMKALQIRRREKSDFGITASYNHLSDYYLIHNPDSALFYAREMYGLAQKTNSADSKLDALRKLIRLAPAAEAKFYFRQYVHLDDSIVAARNAAKNQYALIKYQSEKNKSENLLLQKDNSEKELKILWQRIWIYGIVVIVCLSIAFFFWWFRKKQRQIEWESQATIQAGNLATSQKVHDIVANGLYRIMNEIEYKDEIKKEELLDKIDHLYERSRDISYEPVSHKNSAKERINEMITSFASPNIAVSLVGNEEKIWDIIPREASAELEHALQELMINMCKHSRARHVVIRFDLSGNTLVISYRDDGIGFQPGFKFGNGLKSTGNRITRMGGELIFVEENSAGASIKIVIPIRT